MTKPTTKPNSAPAKQGDAPAAARGFGKMGAVPRRELERQQAQYQRERAAVQQRAMVKRRTGR
jgi:hypothetical protein